MLAFSSIHRGIQLIRNGHLYFNNSYFFSVCVCVRVCVCVFCNYLSLLNCLQILETVPQGYLGVCVCVCVCVGGGGGVVLALKTFNHQLINFSVGKSTRIS